MKQTPEELAEKCEQMLCILETIKEEKHKFAVASSVFTACCKTMYVGHDMYVQLLKSMASVYDWEQIDHVKKKADRLGAAKKGNQ